MLLFNKAQSMTQSKTIKRSLNKTVLFESILFICYAVVLFVFIKRFDLTFYILTLLVISHLVWHFVHKVMSKRI